MSQDTRQVGPTKQIVLIRTLPKVGQMYTELPGDDHRPPNDPWTQMMLAVIVMVVIVVLGCLIEAAKDATRLLL